MNPMSLTGYLIDKKFPSEDIRTYRSMAKQSLYQQLIFEGFTEDQAQKAVDQLYV